MADSAGPDADVESIPYPASAAGGTQVQSPSAAADFLATVGGIGPEPPPGYQLLDKLGRGGMGVVYLALQTDLGRQVALKMILSGEYASDEELVRFETEVKLVASVRHENVVQVHHAGRHDGRPFLALEYLPDGSLSDLLRDGPLPPRESAQLVEQIARGVAACHEVGILHRDLKPGNVLLQIPNKAAAATDAKTAVSNVTSKTSQSIRAKSKIVPKVADFGLAKRLDSLDGLTHTGAVLGTPSYMPPEQARGDTLAATADVYSIGAIFYATLTGRPPFQSPSRDETLRRVIHDDPLPVRQLLPSTPRDLETICLKCLAKDAAARYATASELADDLQRWMKGEPIFARRANVFERGWKLVKRNREWAAVFLALAVGFGVAVQQAIAAHNAEAKANWARAAEVVEGKRKETTLAFFIRAFSHASASGRARRGGEVNPKLTIKEALDFAVSDIGDTFAKEPEIEVDIRSNVGLIYHEMKDYPAAAAQFERVAALQECIGTTTDLDRMTNLVGLGDTYRVLRDDRAQATLEKAHRISKVVPHGVEKYKCINTIGRAYHELNRPAEGLEYYQEALAGRRQLLRDAIANGTDTRRPREEVAKSLHNIGVYHYDHSNYEKAESLLLEAYSERDQVLTLKNPDTIATAQYIADLYYYWKPMKAEEWYRRALEATKKILPDSWSQASDELRLAQHLLKYGTIAEAEKYLEAGCQCLGRCGQELPEGVKGVVAITMDEVRKYWVQKKQPEKADPWLKKLAAIGK